MYRRTTAALAIACFAVNFANGADIVCDPLLVQKAKWGYNRVAPDHCEGEYFRMADNPGYSSVLQVVSLVLRFGNIDPQGDENLRVEWKGANPSQIVTVTATSLRPEHSYRMDAVVDASKARYYEWSTEFTRHEKLRSSEVAVVAQTLDGVLLPVTVGVNQDSSSAPRPFLVIKSTKSLGDLQYTNQRVGVKSVESPTKVPVSGLFTTIPLVLSGAGDYRLNVTAHLKDGTLLALPLKFRYVE
jgi:hypothetical protein